MQDYIDAKISIEPSITGTASLNTFKYIDAARYLILNEGALVTESGSYIDTGLYLILNEGALVTESGSYITKEAA